MTVYFLFYAAVIGVSLMLNTVSKNKEKVNKIICIISFSLLVLIIGLRHPSMGHDLRYFTGGGYIEAFEKISKFSWREVFSLSYMNYEKGYIILNKLIGSIWLNTNFFILVCSFLSIFPIFVVVYKKSCDSLFSIFIYTGIPCFLMTYSGLRQAIAIGICFFALIFVEKKKILPFVLTILLAFSIHSSAIVFLIAYPVYHMQLGRNARFVSVFIIPVVYMLREQLFDIFAGLLLGDPSETYGEGSSTLFLVFSLIYVFCIIFSDYSKKQNGYMNLFLLACCTQAFGQVHNLAMRITYYFMTTLVILLPSVLKKVKMSSGERVLSSTLIMGAFVAFGLYSIYVSTWSMAYPYHFFWESL